jgi:hypothetical protein
MNILHRNCICAFRTALLEFWQPPKAAIEKDPQPQAVPGCLGQSTAPSGTSLLSSLTARPPCFQLSAGVVDPGVQILDLSLMVLHNLLRPQPLDTLMLAHQPMMVGAHPAGAGTIHALPARVTGFCATG